MRISSRGRSALSLLLGAPVLAAGFLLPMACGPVSQSCGIIAYPNGSLVAAGIHATGTTCTTARNVAEASYQRKGAPYTTLGFTCGIPIDKPVVVPRTASLPTHAYACHNNPGRASVSFTAGT